MTADQEQPQRHFIDETAHYVLEVGTKEGEKAYLIRHKEYGVDEAVYQVFGMAREALGQIEEYTYGNVGGNGKSSITIPGEVSQSGTH